MGTPLTGECEEIDVDPRGWCERAGHYGYDASLEAASDAPSSSLLMTRIS